MTREAFAFARDFEAAPPSELCVDRHYLLCASQGALRLEAHGKSWLLPPARAALIAAGEPIQVAIPQPVTTSSVLFDTRLCSRATRATDGVRPQPPGSGPGIGMRRLARRRGATAAVRTQRVRRAGRCGVAAGAAPQPGHRPRRSVAGAAPGTGPDQRTAGRGHVRFEDVAREVGLAPRSLARRFEDESGMTWRAVLRRMRVLRAIEELAAGEDSVTTIAHTVGYTSLSAFNAGFRDLTGRTPTQYRASFRT